MEHVSCVKMCSRELGVRVWNIEVTEECTGSSVAWTRLLRENELRETHKCQQKQVEEEKLTKETKRRNKIMLLRIRRFQRLGSTGSKSSYSNSHLFSNILQVWIQMSAMVLEQKKQEPSGTGMIIDDNHEGNWQYSFTKMCVSYEPIVPPCKHSYTFARDVQECSSQYCL